MASPRATLGTGNDPVSHKIMTDIKLSTLAIVLGLLIAALNAYGLLKPDDFAAKARKFPR